MAFNFSPIFNGWQGFTPTGLPLSGGFIYTYLAGTSTPSPTYTTSVGNVANSNPIALLSDGRPPQEIWLNSALSYKFILTDSLLNPIATYDNIVGIDNSVPPALSEWVISGLTPSYVNATTFTLAGNQTALFEVGRRVRYTIGAGQYTGSITSSVFGAVTTVVLATDAIPLDASLSAVDYGFLDALKPSVPTAFKSTVTAPTTNGTVLQAGSYLDVLTGAASPPSLTAHGMWRDTTNGAAISSPTGFAVWVNNSRWLQVTSDGRLYGLALHNNAGAVTGTTNQYIASGAYTPTFTNVTNIAGVSNQSNCGKWMRVGNIVKVVVDCNPQATAAGGLYSEVGISLPIPSNLPSSPALNNGSLTGVGSNQDTTANTLIPVQVTYDATNDRARAFFYAATTNGLNMRVSFDYEVF